MTCVYEKVEREALIRRADREYPQWRSVTISEPDRRDIGALSVANGYIYAFIYTAVLAESELRHTRMKTILDERWQQLFDELGRPDRYSMTLARMKELFPTGDIRLEEGLYNLEGYQRFRQRARDGLIDPICDRHGSRALRLNVHNRLDALDPPREHPPRRWRCTYCQAEGFIEELTTVACNFVYPPCEHCGQTPICALTCRGIAAVLGRDDVCVIGLGSSAEV